LDLPGFDILKQKLPIMNQGWRVIVLGIIPISCLSFALLSFWFFDWYLALIFEQTPGLDFFSSYIPVLTQILILILAYYLLSKLWRNKTQYLTKYGIHGYQRALLLFYLPGMALLISTVIHLLVIDGPPIIRQYPLNILFVVYCWTVGGSLLGRALFFFGFDHMFVVYLYFPEESRMVNQRLYSVIRHPAYFGLIHIAIGAAFLSGNVNSFISILIFIIGEYLWLSLIEEKELLARFGEEYAEYKKKVPAFFPHLRNIIPWFRLIWGLGEWKKR